MAHPSTSFTSRSGTCQYQGSLPFDFHPTVVPLTETQFETAGIASKNT